jgi:hypothetical protein
MIAIGNKDIKIFYFHPLKIGYFRYKENWAYYCGLTKEFTEQLLYQATFSFVILSSLLFCAFACWYAP